MRAPRCGRALQGVSDAFVVCGVFASVYVCACLYVGSCGRCGAAACEDGGDGADGGVLGLKL